MIRRLRRKFVLIIMAVVTMILLAIFFTLLIGTQRNNEQMSLAFLHQVLNNPRPVSDESRPFEVSPDFDFDRPGSPQERPPLSRLPALVLELDSQGHAAVALNQLHFLEAENLTQIAALVLASEKENGVLSGYGLRYLRRETELGTRMALADISLEQEMLRTQIFSSLLVGGVALLVFFGLSLLLARLAVRPMELAWERQKQFIEGASHELKTPLTVILSNAEMLQRGRSEDRAKNALRMEHIHAEAVRMKHLVEDMLTLARSDYSGAAQVFESVNFSELAQSAVLMYESIAYDEGKTLVWELAEDLHVLGDGERLQQVLHILLDNAQKYSPKDSVIQVNLTRGEHHSLLLKMTNMGDSIPKSELRSIFLRFYRRDAARSAPDSFGLGLSIAESIVGEHRGKIWAESEPEAGNNFFVSLPSV